MTRPETNPFSSGSPFWRFSLQLYRLPGVAEACIALQEDAGVDVNLLLFLLWQATQRRRLSVVQVSELDQHIGPWRALTVIPLRNLRRALKSPPALVAAAAAEAFRTKIKAVELESERLQQEAMYELAGHASVGEPATSVAEAARGSIAAYEKICPAVFDPAAVDTVVAALAKIKDATG